MIKRQLRFCVILFTFRIFISKMQIRKTLMYLKMFIYIYINTNMCTIHISPFKISYKRDLRLKVIQMGNTSVFTCIYVCTFIYAYKTNIQQYVYIQAILYITVHQCETIKITMKTLTVWRDLNNKQEIYKCLMIFKNCQDIKNCQFFVGLSLGIWRQHNYLVCGLSTELIGAQ